MMTLENIDRDGFASETLISDAGVASLLGISVRTLARMKASGRGPAHRKIGKRVWYPKADVVSYIAACTVQPFNSRGGAAAHHA
jgi:predicted DNA-binding transcriptional regulator AlpA